MKSLASVLLMVSLLAMSVAAASADITRPPCSAQLRADDMCYAVALSGSQTEPITKPGPCLLCILPTEVIAAPVAGQGVQVAVTVAADLPPTARWTAPWRPPRF